MIAMVEKEYRLMADESLEELRGDVGVQKVELSRVEIQTGGK
jgi:hypothetical protein